MTSQTQPPALRLEADFSPTELKQARKSVAGSAIGNAIEWFDYGIYGYLIVYISQLFFTFGEEGGTLPRILAFSTFAISFLIRPLGGMVLGPLGDRIGRRKVLIFTIVMISVSTACIAALPTFDQVGYLAPVLLVLLRMVQGFSAGGEYAGAAVFMSEHAPDNRRGFYGSFLEFGTLAGFSAAAILCTGLTLVVGEEGMMAGWWRLPFALTLVLGGIALWMRRHLEESETFTEDSSKDNEVSTAPQALGTLLRKYPGQLFKLFGFIVLVNVAFYLVLTYMPSYLTTTLGHGSVESNMTLVLIQLVMIALIVPLGALSDRIGRKPLLVTASIGFVLLSVPAVQLMQSAGLWGQIVGIGTLGLLLVMLLSTISSTLPALFPTSVRYSGFAIGYNLSTAVFGGTAAVANEALIGATGNSLVPGWYLMAAGVIGLISVLTFKETAGRSLRGNVIPGSDDQQRRKLGERLVGAGRP
ncbi:MFS transporter [Paeniglutamicibacter sulfureus]|uniref:MHS family proline/betaine transporter-like MFS transporter n=1 Tax=Paeniglutamicibacter sulfureus TaxID=43666 RepID=A0ABU2BJN2_9MICC|nr:MFS transporter [Paeniglutamicibacter sulfureus]MDO2933744.1 MFS transporter [Paeniglutamicibacter sulfureus]MDR7358184.1 MHS family proline/betaine transporter-like MFS transporter [Paeniglutamicibacter sulfureus]